MRLLPLHTTPVCISFPVRFKRAWTFERSLSTDNCVGICSVYVLWSYRDQQYNKKNPNSIAYPCSMFKNTDYNHPHLQCRILSKLSYYYTALYTPPTHATLHEATLSQSALPTWTKYSPKLSHTLTPLRTALLLCCSIGCTDISWWTAGVTVWPIEETRNNISP